MVTTSNREPDDLYKHGLNRQLFLPFIALIRQRMEVVCLDSRTDYRQNRQGGQVWFAPADAAARAELDAVWAELTGDATPEPLVLTVQGRQVPLPAHVGRAARSSFWDLCGKPLGPADYLAVARAVRRRPIRPTSRRAEAASAAASRLVSPKSSPARRRRRCLRRRNPRRNPRTPQAPPSPSRHRRRRSPRPAVPPPRSLAPTSARAPPPPTPPPTRARSGAPRTSP